MPRRRSVPDAVGLLVLAGLVAWFLGFVYGFQTAIGTWCLGYPLLAIVALYAWHHEKWPTDPVDLMRYALFSIPFGATSFAIDAAISTSNYPKLPFREAIWHAGSPFGIFLTICICPGFTAVLLAGAVRAFLLTHTGTTSKK